MKSKKVLKIFPLLILLIVFLSFLPFQFTTVSSSASAVSKPSEMKYIYAKVYDYNGDYWIKMNLDGTGRQKLVNSDILEIELNSGKYPRIDNTYYYGYDSCLVMATRKNGKISTKNIWNCFVDATKNLVIRGDWLYFIDEDFKLVRTKLDGSNSRVISEHANELLSVNANIIIYFNQNIDDNNNLTEEVNKINLDGSSKTTLLSNINILRVVGSDDKYTYILKENNDRISELFSIKISNAEVKKITDNVALFKKTEDEWIYYTDKFLDDWDDLPSYYRIKNDGSSKQLINTSQINKQTRGLWDLFMVKGDWAYCLVSTTTNQVGHFQEGKLARFSISSGKVQMITNEDVDFYDMSFKDNIFCFKTIKGISTVKADGTSKKQIFSGVASFVRDGDWVYIKDWKHNLFRVKIDGTNKKTLLDSKKPGEYVYNYYIKN